MCRSLDTGNHYKLAQFTLVALLSLTSLCFDFGHAAKILIPAPLSRGRGHTTLLSALSAELSSRNHHVTILVPADKKLKTREKFETSQAAEILEYPTIPVKESEAYKEVRAGNRTYPTGLLVRNLMEERFREQVSYCRQLMNNTSVMRSLRERHFDLIIEDMANGCDVLLPEVLNVPFIALTSNNELAFMNYYIFGFPLELSYVLSPYIDGGPDRHLFFENRFRNVLIRLGAYTFLDFAPLFAPLQREFSICPERSMHDLARKAQFWLSHDSSLLEGAHPIMPNYSPVGGMAAARPGELPLDFQGFADGSGDAGFIVISCGSIVANGFNDTVTESIAQMLKRLPQRVMWKHGGPVPANMGSNTRVSPWLPQIALLAHSKARLYIGHGGLNGIYEALYHGVPMILIPQTWQAQKANALKVERYGYGVHLDKAMVSADTLEQKIHFILDDSRVAERTRRCSEILQDADPMDRAVYWIEHILKFGGGHLRPGVFDLNFVQYYMIDVFAVVLLFLMLLILIFYMIVTVCVSLCKQRQYEVKSAKAKKIT